MNSALCTGISGSRFLRMYLLYPSIRPTRRVAFSSQGTSVLVDLEEVLNLRFSSLEGQEVL